MSQLLNHSFIWFVQNTDSFRTLYEWVIESFTQLICSKHRFIQEQNKRWVSYWIILSYDLFKTLIHSEVTMSESLNHSLNQFIQKHWFIQEQKKRLMSYWIILSYDLFKTLIHSEVSWSESLNHSLNQFIQKHWFIQEQKTRLVSYWIILSYDLFKTLIHSLSHWIINSTNSFKNTDLFKNKTRDKSLNHSFVWFVKTLIHSEVSMSESLNHSLNQFIRNTDLFKNKQE